MHKAWSSIEEVSYCFWRSSVKLQGHTAKKIVDFDPNWPFPDCNTSLNSPHEVQFSCAINQPLLAHHWMAHQCLLTSRFVAPSIPWGVSAPGGRMRKQLLKDHNFLNNSPIFIMESSTFNILLSKKHCIQYISIWKIVLDLVRGTWHHNFMAGCGSLLWANTCSLWSGIKSWPGAGCLQRLSDVVGSSQLRLCHTCILDVMNGYEMMHKAWISIEEVPYCFSRSYVKLQGHTAL